MWPFSLCPREQLELQPLYLHSRERTAARGKIWRIKEAIGSRQLYFKEVSLKLPHDTSNSTQNLIIWSNLSTRENRKCYYIWDIFPAKECKFYSHGRKMVWILMNNGSLYCNYNSHFINEKTNTQRVTCSWWHSWFMSEPGYESLSSWSKFSTDFTIQQPPSVEIWNYSFLTMIFFPQNWHSFAIISIKKFWTSQYREYITTPNIILVLDFLSLPFCDVLKALY